MEVEGVDVLVYRLIRTTKAEEIRSYDAVSRLPTMYGFVSTSIQEA